MLRRGMADRRDGDDDLIFDIGFGLKRAGLKQPIEACRVIAARIVEHLKLARWQFSQREPDEPHGSSARRDER
jgi:hypothetical protein